MNKHVNAYTHAYTAHLHIYVHIQLKFICGYLIRINEKIKLFEKIIIFKVYNYYFNKHQQQQQKLINKHTLGYIVKDTARAISELFFLSLYYNIINNTCIHSTQ